MSATRKVRRVNLDGDYPGGTAMTKRIRRTLVVLAAVTGLLALWTQAANAYISYNHCEPLRRC